MNIAISLIAFDDLRLGKCTLCSHDYIRSIISDFFSCLNLIHELTEFSCTFICGVIYWCCSFSLFHKVNVGFFFLDVFISSELKESINTLHFFWFLLGFCLFDFLNKVFCLLWTMVLQVLHGFFYILLHHWESNHM